MAAVKKAPVPPVAPVAPPANGLTALVQQAVTNVTAPAVTKRPPVSLVAGVNALAPANALPVVLAGVGYTGVVPATNPALRGNVGAVSTKLGAKLALGNGKSPRSPHGAVMWAAVTAALAAGNCTPAALATAAGSGGAAFISYCVKNGWLVKH